MIEFKYELDYILEDLPDNVKGTLKGSIIAKADKVDQNAAMEFVDSKVEDGTIDRERADRIGHLLRDFCIYR
jgi:hypothetical protein